MREFSLSPAFDLLLNFFKLDQPYSLEIAITNKLGRIMDLVFSFTCDFEIVEVN